jgi:sarcosine oxidase
MTSQETRYDVIVLGLGVMGSAASYHLARAGKRVLALEQFELDHRMGSSYGESRIIRYAYAHPTYVEMAKAAFLMWRELEADSGRRLMFQTGGLDFGPAGAPTLNAARDNLRGAGIACEWLSPGEVMARFPQFRPGPDMMGLYQPDAAYLAASQCVIAQAEMAQKYGATLLTKTPVLGIDPLPGAVRVHTAGAVYEAGALVITAGPWAPKVLGALGLNLPLQPTREQIVFFNPTERTLFEPPHMPVFIFHQQPWYYGLPNVDGTGFKAAIHCNGEATDPDTCKRTADSDYIEQIREFVEQYLPRGVGPITDSRVCLYTMTPDEHFIIDRHPAHPNIVFGAGFSGHGFKFGILIGRILADLATSGATPFDLTLFRADRFKSV